MEAFFLPAPNGARFCLYHEPTGTVRAGVIFVPAFAEEMNKSRHVVAQMARRLAASGVGVLLIDLQGCGDSTGTLEDSSWDDWREDLRLATGFMRQRGHDALVLWGMRLGAVLAAQCASERPSDFVRCLLWQPVAQGEAHLSQFLRLRMANALLSGAKQGETGKQLRARLAGGESLEIAGYRLSSAMAAALERLDLGSIRPPCPVDWFEVLPEANRALPVAAARVIEQWRDAGTDVSLTPIVGEPFWGATNAAELVQCESLVEGTMRVAKGWP